MTPKLRFPEFTDEWQVKKLGDIAPLQRGFDLPNQDQVPGAYPIVFSNGPLRTHTDYKVKGPGVVTGRSGTIGKVHYIEQDYWPHNTSLWVTDFKNSDPKYVYYLYDNLRLEKFGGGSSVPTLNRNDVHAYKIATPSKPEQQKIADFMGGVDSKLASIQTKVAAMHEYKKGVMQALFSGKLRFKDENGDSYPDWEERKLGSIVKEVNEKTDESNKYETLSSTTKGLFSQREYFNKNIASEDNSGYKILRINQVVFSPQNLWMGNINYNDRFEEGIVSPSYKIFKPVNVVEDFLKQILKTNRMLYEYTQASEQGASIVRRNLDISSFLNIRILLPSLEEQQKIATFLTALDARITAETTRLTSAKEWKKGLLQRMFV